MFKFFKLGRDEPRLFDSFEDLGDWLALFEDETAPSIEEIETADGIFEVVMCGARPVGTIAHPASAALLDKIQPMRFAWRKFGEAA